MKFEFKSFKELEKIKHPNSYGGNSYYTALELEDQQFLDINIENKLDYNAKIVKNPLNNCQMGSIGGSDKCNSPEDFIDLIVAFKILTMKNMVLLDMIPARVQYVEAIFKGNEQHISEYIRINSEYKSTRGSKRVLILLAINNTYFQVK